jgi:hypothetical protein
MSFDELIPVLQNLPRADKLRVIQLMAFELAKEDEVVLFNQQTEYPIWSPYDASEAADTLLEMLREDNIEPSA